MTARGAAADAAPQAHPDPLKIVGHVTQAVIEGSRVPVLLLPPACAEALPWQRALVPLSGGAQADEGSHSRCAWPPPSTSGHPAGSRR